MINCSYKSHYGSSIVLGFARQEANPGQYQCPTIASWVTRDSWPPIYPEWWWLEIGDKKLPTSSMHVPFRSRSQVIPKYAFLDVLEDVE